ncbi:trypsin-like serine protease [Planctobacterium marinum]|uniref:Peptidase S1 domain-containing protein n=1 Tax=Planctobacterium marinum TaxID=1631968 RepID=A0AA48HJA1_9ALTE|nr:hypothetical protein MACH26_29820 [Planctobacterium marinum]
MKILRVILIIFAITSLSAQSIVIRHDKSDEEYLNSTDAIEAHVTFTTSTKDGDFVVGSGTYVGNSWVLTAAHVANFFEENDVAQIKSERLKILDILLHENWKDRQYGFDIAMVKIEMPSGDIAPVTLFALEPEKDDVITIAGRGDTGTGMDGITSRDLKMRVAQNKIEEIKGQWLSFSFSAPEDGALENEGIGGGGDSGSPAYIIDKGTIHLVALSSWQDTEATNWKEGFYGAIDYYTYLNHYRDWIESHLDDNKPCAKHQNFMF